MCAVVQNTMFVRTAQICSLATDRSGQPLLTCWCYTGQSWMFALTVAALKTTYLVLHLYCL